MMVKFKTMVTAVAVIGALTMALASNGMKKANPTEKWFLYDSQAGGINDPAAYTPTGNNGQDVPTCNEPSGERCAIEAVPDETNPDQPDLSQVSETRLKESE